MRDQNSSDALEREGHDVQSQSVVNHFRLVSDFYTRGSLICDKKEVVHVKNYALNFKM